MKGKWSITTAILCFSVATATAAPVWDTYPILVCRYDGTVTCDWDMTSCGQGTGNAILNFDFRKSEIVAYPEENLSKARPAEPITSRISFMGELGEVNSVSSKDTLYVFQAVSKGQSIIEGTAQRSTWWGGGVHTTASFKPGQLFNVQMTCHPG